MNAKRILKRFVKKRARDYLLDVRYPRLYSKAAKEPVDGNSVLLISEKLDLMPESFTAMREYLTSGYDYDVEFIGLGQSKVGFRRFRRRCERLLPKLARAKYVFLDDANDIVSCVNLRAETKVIQLWHACGAFKKWGRSTSEKGFGGTEKRLRRHPFYRNLDLVTVTSPEVEWAYREAMMLEDVPETVQALGSSRTDVFFDENFLRESRLDVEAEAPACRGRMIALYAPTFRGPVMKAAGPDALDYGLMKNGLGDGWVLLVKHHPFVKEPPEIPEDCRDFAFMVPQLPTSVLLAAADMLITDYSSVSFEYSLLSRPMAFFAHDLEEYDDWRGFYYGYDELTPGPILRNTRDLVRYIASLPESFDAEAVEAFRRRFMIACDGQSTERIASRMLEDGASHARKPLLDRMGERNGEGPDISIIVPAHDAEGVLSRSVESVLAQTYPLERMELIVVDDGSSDGTWKVLEAYRMRYPELFRIWRLPVASGSPAAPRNAGIELARGEYVFFLDADDWLGPEAVERMLAHALDWGSDVLLVKLRGEDGRDIPKSMFRANDPMADIYRSKVMWSFSPLKLFRRTLIENLRFPDFMPEDISFVLRAYCRARVVSVAADYSYYHATMEDVESHASTTTWDDVESNLRAYKDIVAFIADEVPESERDWTLMRRLFARDVRNTILSIEAEPDRKLADGQIKRLRELFGDFYRPGAYRTLPEDTRRILARAFEGVDRSG